MAPNSRVCLPIWHLRATQVATLVLCVGCSSFFKVTPEGEPTPAQSPTAKPPEKVASVKAAPVKGKPLATPPLTRTPEPVPPQLEVAASEPAAVASDSAGTHRLMRLATVWQTVALHHPYVASRSVAWDSALVRALPKVRETRDEAGFAAAVDQLLRVLGDPITRIEYDEPRDIRSMGADTVRSETTADGVLLLHLPASARYSEAESLHVAHALAAPTSRVIVDLRTATSGGAMAVGANSSVVAAVNAFTDGVGVARSLTSLPLLAPSERLRRVGGTARSVPDRPFGEGADAWVRLDAPMIPAGSTIARRIVVIANRATVIPRGLVALVSAGRATLVAETSLAAAGATNEPTLDESSLVSSVRIPLGERIFARVRIGELIHADGTTGLMADTSVAAAPSTTDSAPALRAALQIVRSGRAPRAKRAPMTDAPAASLPVAMDNQNYPTMGARLLAGFRLWSAMRNRHAHRDLYDEDVDAVFERVLPKLESAQNEQQYAIAIGELASALDDAQGVLAGPSVQTWLGTSTAPFRVRYVEGRALITDIVRDATTSALALSTGTEITAADGFPIAAWLSEHRRIGAASNEWTRAREQMRVLPLGPEGAASFKLRDASGKERAVSIPRRASNAALLPQVQRPDAAPTRRLDGNIGYVDLERLGDHTLDSALASLREARALVLDLRSRTGAGNAMDILLGHLATQPRFIRAREVHRYATAPCLAPTLREAALHCADERMQSAEWSTVDTTGHYRGRIVVLIDEQTQGAMERLALALESAATVTFIGSPSAGAASPAATLELPGALTVGIPLVEVRRADGGQVQRVGITPSVDVRPTVRGVRNHQDEVIERAQQWLVQQLDPPVRRKR